MESRPTTHPDPDRKYKVAHLLDGNPRHPRMNRDWLVYDTERGVIVAKTFSRIEAQNLADKFNAQEERYSHWRSSPEWEEYPD